MISDLFTIIYLFKFCHLFLRNVYTTFILFFIFILYHKIKKIFVFYIIHLVILDLIVKTEKNVWPKIKHKQFLSFFSRISNVY